MIFALNQTFMGLISFRYADNRRMRGVQSWLSIAREGNMGIISLTAEISEMGSCSRRPFVPQWSCDSKHFEDSLILYDSLLFQR